ncbi:hypothetical protein WN943_016199 [Citrus x changshan-huyou]
MLLAKQIHNWITKKPREAYQIPVFLHHGSRKRQEWQKKKVEGLEKSKHEQSLESVGRFTAMTEKELELYSRNIALNGEKRRIHL